jgi:hypothetical protein
VNKAHRTGGITLWAWVISILFHAGLLAVFASVYFSNVPKERLSVTRLTPGRAQLKKIAESTPITPKPKIKKLFKSTLSSSTTKKPLDLDLRSRIKPSFETSSTHLSETSELIVNGDVWSRGVEFFGQFTDVRKICYVVDCSGSMHGRLGLVKQQLKTSIASLQPDQFFYIIFFLQGDKLLESGDGFLARATPKAKTAANEFIDTVTPAGTTDPLNALNRAMQIRDYSKNSCGLIYFLSDGFDLQPEGADNFAQQVENLRKNLAPSAIINTIGFWTQDQDRKILETVAKQSGGQFVNVEW